MAEEMYQSIWSARYCRDSPLLKVFSEHEKICKWRRLWCWLAEAELEAGLPNLSSDALAAMKANVANIDWDFQREEEARSRHDVMSHIAAFEKAAPAAKGLIHLGATSAFVQDNADVLTIRDALDHLIPSAFQVLRNLADFATKEAGRPTVGLTHYQPATLTTVGKRACLWLQDLLVATQEMVRFREGLRMRGIQGATGTRASFLALFKGDRGKVKALNERVIALANASSTSELSQRWPLGGWALTGQTYPRLEDARLLNALGLYAAAVERMCLDIRVLQSRGEVMEGHGKAQVGSSAMPYKRNPMQCERLCGLARALRNLVPNGTATAAVQGFERTLDDSANRRIVLTESFFSLDAILTTLRVLTANLHVAEANVARNVAKELPFLALEPVLMALVEAGRDRQEAHHRIKEKSRHAQAQMETAQPLTLQEMLSGDGYFDPVRDLVGSLMENPGALTGDAANQVAEFVADEIQPFLAPFHNIKAHQAQVNV